MFAFIKNGEGVGAEGAQGGYAEPSPSVLYVKHSSVPRRHWAARQCLSVLRVWSTRGTNTKYPIKQSFPPNCDKQCEGELQCSLIQNGKQEGLLQEVTLGRVEIKEVGHGNTHL